MAGEQALDGRADLPSIDRAFRSSRHGKAAVDALLPLLSPWELLYLRQKVNAISIESTDANAFATCIDLPGTTLIDIGSYLDCTDLIRLRAVSKAWKIVWMQHEVLRDVFRRHFPEIWALISDNEDLEALLLRSMRLNRLENFSSALFDFVPWNGVGGGVTRTTEQPGHAAQPNTRTTDAEPVMDHRVPGKPNRYNEGRFAWESSQGAIIVEDVRSGQRDRLVVSDDARRGRSPVVILALSSKVIVAGIGPKPMHL